MLDHLYRMGRRPGVVLGPNEAFLALLMWIGECMAATKQSCPSKRDYLIGDKFRAPRVSGAQRHRIRTAYLMFGSLDGNACKLIADSALQTVLGLTCRRELFGDYLSLDYQRRYDPFEPSIVDGPVPIDLEIAKELAGQTEVLLPTILSVLRHTGYYHGPNGVWILKRLPPTWAQDMRPFVRERVSQYLQLSLEGLHALVEPRIVNAIWAVLGSILDAVRSGLPFLAAHAAGPAWLDKGTTESQLRILELVIEEVPWLPRPKTFREAQMMLEDDRICGLRRDIDLWVHKLNVADLSGIDDVTADVRRRLQHFRGKPWASQAARLCTYIALPVSLAEALICHTAPAIGASIGVAGVGSQALADVMARLRKKSWLSLGKDCL